MSQVDLSKVPAHVPPPEWLDATAAQSEPTYLRVQVYGREQRYPLEVWRVSGGYSYAIVTQVDTNTSLVNAQEKVIAAIKEAWGESTVVIEFWPKSLLGMRYYRIVHELSGGGGTDPAFNDLDTCGLYLKPPR